MTWNWTSFVTRPVAAEAVAAAADAANGKILPGLPLVLIASQPWIVLQDGSKYQVGLNTRHCVEQAERNHQKHHLIVNR